MPRIIVLTPQMAGADGVSTISREVVAALRGEVGRRIAALDVWSLGDAAMQPDGDGRGVRVRSGGGSRAAFATFGIREAGVDGDTVALVLHAHLLPVALPLAARGARVVAMLLGIEAWKPLTRLQRATLRRAWRVAAISRHTMERFRGANPELVDVPVRICYPGPPNGTTNGPNGTTNDPNGTTNDPNGTTNDPNGTTNDPNGTTNGPNDPNAPNDPNDPNDPNAPTAFALIVGRMSSAERYKGHDELLECWTLVRAAHPSARLVIAGGGDDEPRLREKARALGLDGEVRFEGVAGAARLAELYSRAAFFVMPSRDEGFGLVYLEAMRAGLPCIAAPGAAEEIVEDGVSGLIADPRQPGALAAALLRLFGSATARDTMGRAAARCVEARFAGFPQRLLDLLAC